MFDRAVAYAPYQDQLLLKSQQMRGVAILTLLAETARELVVVALGPLRAKQRRRSYRQRELLAQLRAGAQWWLGLLRVLLVRGVIRRARMDAAPGFG
jgi:hypothetical protein